MDYDDPHTQTIGLDVASINRVNQHLEELTMLAKSERNDTIRWIMLFRLLFNEMSHKMPDDTKITIKEKMNGLMVEETKRQRGLKSQFIECALEVDELLRTFALQKYRVRA